MTMAWALFDTKARRMKAVIAALETAVEGKRAETNESEGRLRETIKTTTKELTRMPVAGALVWRGRRDV